MRISNGLSLLGSISLVILATALSLPAQTVGIGAGIPAGQIQYFDNNGRVAAGYKLCSYGAGGSTPQVTYSDSQLTTPNANPTVLNSAGRASVWLNSASYKLVLRGVGADGTCSTGTIVWTSDNISAPTPSITGGVVNILSFGALCDGSTDDQAAFATALATGNNVTIPGNRTCVIGTALTMSTNNQAFIGAPGVIIKSKTGFSGSLLTITGTGNTVNSIIFNCNAQGTNGGICVYANGPTNFQFLNNTIQNTVAGQYAFRCDSCTGTLVQGNTLTTVIKSAGISIFGSSTRVVVTGNNIDRASQQTNGTLVGAAFEAKTGSGATLLDVVFSANTARTANGFCYEGGNFGGGTSASRIVFTGNTCAINNTTGSAHCDAASGTIKSCGGYSLSTASDSDIIGNTFNASGQTVDIAGIEMTLCTRCTAADNVLYGATTDTASTGSVGISLACNGCKVQNNQVYGWGAQTENAGIKFLTITGFEQQDINTVTGNTIIYPAGTNQTGIYFNCNKHSGSTNSTSGEVVANNVLSGAASTTPTGITLAQNDGGCTVTNNVVIGNHVDNASKGILLGTALLTTVIGNDMLTVTTPVTCNSCTYADQSNYGQQFFPTGPVLVGIATYAGSDKFHVGGGVGTSFTGTTCITGAQDCATTPSNGASPILRIVGAGSGSKIRLDLQAQTDGTVTINSTDTGNMILESGSQNWLTLGTHGLAPRSGTLSGIGACGSAQTSPAFAVITDSTTTTWGADIAGSSTNVVLAYCNGVSTHWTVVGKAGS